MKLSVKDFFSKCDEIRSLLRIWSYLLKKSLLESFIFRAVVEIMFIASLGQTSHALPVAILKKVSIGICLKSQPKLFLELFSYYSLCQFLHDSNQKSPMKSETHAQPTLQMCSWEKVFGKYAANLRQINFIAITLRHGCFPVNLLHFSEHLFLKTPMEDCFWISLPLEEICFQNK